MLGRKIIQIFLMLALVFTIGGCDKTEEAWDYENDGIRQPIELPHEPYIPLDHEIRDVSSWELVSEIQAGWNLGNTFETNGRGRNAEMTWGNPTNNICNDESCCRSRF